MPVHIELKHDLNHLIYGKYHPYVPKLQDKSSKYSRITGRKWSKIIGYTQNIS